jgi:hypothetical protein
MDGICHHPTFSENNTCPLIVLTPPAINKVKECLTLELNQEIVLVQYSVFQKNIPGRKPGAIFLKDPKLLTVDHDIFVAINSVLFPHHTIRLICWCNAF